MIKIFTDVISRRHFNADGNLFSNDMPQMFFGGTETVYWQLCQNVFDLDAETQTPETDWPKYTGFSDISVIGAFLTADNNYTHKLKGTLAVAIEPGSLLTVTATITGASRSLIDTEGVISLIDNTGEIEEVEYTSRTINGSTVVFTISDGTTVTGTYAQSSEMDVNEAVYMQASMDVGQSDPDNGLFVFTIRAMSEKLRNEIIYSDVQSVTIRGLELAVFKVDPGDSTIEDVGRYVLGTFSVMSGIADTRLNPVVSTARENAVLAYIQTVVKSGTEHEYSIDGSTDWHETRADGDRYLRYRNVLAGGDWSPAVKLPDPVTPYDYWISLGNTGSTSDYFDSITGPQGAPGINGTNGIDGIDGIDGTNGTNGIDGEDGVSTYTKVAWASDNSGSDFSLTPSDELHYRAEIHVTEDIITPTLSDFTSNGAVWVLALATGTIPDASTSVKGLVQFANSTQMVAGTATDLVLSPADLEIKLSGYVSTGILAQASGVATLDGSGKLLFAQLPEIDTGPDISTAIPLALSSSGLAGTGTDAAAYDHVHPNTGLVLASEKGTANGVATLDGSGKLVSDQLPAIDTGPDISTAIPLALSSSGLAGTGTDAAAYDHVHPNTGLVLASEKGTANGVATLDGSGKLVSDQLPAIDTGADISTAIPLALSATGLAGTGTEAAAFDHVHPNDGLVLSSEKGTANGVATLDGSGKLLSEQLPEIDTGPDISTAIPLALSSSGLAGTGTDAAAYDHVHPNTGLVLASEKGTANGVATLDETGKVPSVQLPENTGYVSLGEDGYIPSEQLPPKTFIEILTTMPTASSSDVGRGAIYFGTGGGYTTNHFYKAAEATGTGVSSTSSLLVASGGGETNGSINGNYTYSSGTGYARKWSRNAGSSKIFEVWHANDYWYIHSYEDDGEDGIMHFDEARGSGTDPHLASWETAWDDGFGGTDGNTGSIPSVNQIGTEYTYYTWTDITP